MIGGPALQTNQKREAGAAPFLPGTANNGLSVDPVNGTIVLGQDPGAVGDPAQLLNDRVIPMNSFGINFQQGLFGVPFVALGVSLDNNTGGLFHGVQVQCTNFGGGGLILYRGTNNDNGCVGAIIQLECAGDAAAAVGQFAAWGSAAGNPVFAQGAVGIQSTNVVNPDIVFRCNAIGGGGARPGRVVFSTNNVGVETQEYAFLLPVLANLAFPNTGAQLSADLTINVPGAADGDAVHLGVPIASQVANTCYTAFVSAPNVVTVRFNNYSAAAVNPAAGNFKVGVVKLL